MATGARASGALRIAGVVLPEGVKETISAVGSGYKSLVPGLGLTLACASAEISGYVENFGGKARGQGQVIAHECEVVGNKFCEIYATESDLESKENVGLIMGATSKSISVQSIGTEWYLLGSASTTIYHGGPGCTLPEETEVSGSAAGKLLIATTEAVNHTVEDVTEKEEKELKVAAFYGSEPLYIDAGKAIGALTGKNVGKKFSLD
jgi:hypothetical protein